MQHAAHCLMLLHALLQAKVDEAYKDKSRWTRMGIMCTAGSGWFSSDRTIDEYAKDIWGTQPCMVPNDV